MKDAITLYCVLGEIENVADASDPEACEPSKNADPVPPPRSTPENDQPEVDQLARSDSNPGFGIRLLGAPDPVTQDSAAPPGCELHPEAIARAMNVIRSHQPSITKLIIAFFL